MVPIVLNPNPNPIKNVTFNRLTHQVYDYTQSFAQSFAPILFIVRFIRTLESITYYIVRMSDCQILESLEF
jgi:hypothetical protein